MEQYVKKGISKSNGLEEVMERRQTEKMMEYENTKLDTLIAEEKKKLKEASPTKIDSSQAPNFMAFLSSLFVGKSPAEINEILTYLTQEQIDKLRLLSESMNPNNLTNIRGIMQPQNSSLKETIEIVKLILSMQQPQKSESNNISGKDLIDAFKTGLEVKAQQPANPQPDIQYKMLESTMAEIKAMREDASRQERLRTEREIAELKNRPSGFDELVFNEEKAAKVRKIFGGADTGATNEYSLKKLEMEQNKDIEDRKQSWEEKKWTQEQEGQGKTIEQIKDVLKVVGEGPIGRVLENLGSAGADKLRGSKTRNSNVQARPQQIAQVKCPNCAGDFSANTQLSQIQCPLCGVQLQSGNQPPAASAQETPKDQPPSDSAQTQSNPAPIQEKPVDQTVEVEPIVEQPAK